MRRGRKVMVTMLLEFERHDIGSTWALNANFGIVAKKKENHFTMMYWMREFTCEL